MSTCMCSDPNCAIYGCKSGRTGCPDWTKPYTPTYPQPYYPPVYPTFPQPPAPAPVGWKCPNCGAGVSPDVDICSNCRPFYSTTTYITTSTTEAITNDREDSSSDS